MLSGRPNLVYSPGLGLKSWDLGPFGPDLRPDLDLTWDLDLDLSLTIDLARGQRGHTGGGRVGIQQSERALIATFCHILTQSQEKHCTQHLEILSPRPIWQFNLLTVSKIQQP